ncbi:sodium/solute symporter [Temperatibacter marinus]|uniref:Sodium/solute symporter n=1 Tax=Temperatibacter marinus TaxID=1456591 RepID=A0AA52EKB5_9PROT|nr:sodium/solute symporter [Temperatibacter marinus]WND03596.1 sodium/solute symporter [Temperatibacter marinus]
MINYLSMLIGFMVFTPLFCKGLSADAIISSGEKQAINPVAIGTFLIFVLSTLGITWWAANQVRSRKEFFVAGGGLKPWQNGMAIAGDFMSAATFLGITGALYFRGIDAFILSVGIMIGWPIILMVVAERFRNLGSFTFIDVLASRFEARPIRIMASCVSLSIVLFYLIAQMVGAGTLIQILFGLDYKWAVIIVGILMIVYVAFGGMVATTWVQIIKASLLLIGGTYLAYAILVHVGFSFERLVQNAIEKSDLGSSLFIPGGWFASDPFAIITVSLTMTFGIMGLPHILMRFFTVKDAVDARKSVFYATSIMGYFYGVILVIGIGASFVLFGNDTILDEAGLLTGGANMVAIHVSRLLGGDFMFGFMAAVSFATILAVVAGLALSGAATLSHDLYGQLFKKVDDHPEKEVKVTKYATVILGILAVIFGFAFEGQNVAVTAAIALAIAASVNCPIIILSLYWQGLTTRGVIWGGYIGLSVCAVLIVLSPAIFVSVFGFDRAPFPYTYPTVVAMPFTFLTIILVSKWDKSDRAREERRAFPAQVRKSEIGSEVLNAGEH